VVGEGVSIEHHSGLSLDRVLDRIEIRRFSKDRIFDDRGYSRYRTDTGVLDGFNTFPLCGGRRRAPKRMGGEDTYSFNMSSLILVGIELFLFSIG